MTCDGNCVFMCVCEQPMFHQCCKCIKRAHRQIGDDYYCRDHFLELSTDHAVAILTGARKPKEAQQQT